jgi:hypothetical protein
LLTRWTQQLDRRPGRTWEEKIFRREEQFQGQAITVWGI